MMSPPHVVQLAAKLGEQLREPRPQPDVPTRVAAERSEKVTAREAAPLVAEALG